MLIIRLLGKLPFPILYFLADFLFFLAYRVIGYRKQVVYKNLRNAFPEKNEQEIKKIAKAFYHRFTYYVVETLKILSISPEEMSRRVEVTQHELMIEHTNVENSVVAFASHQFNWEWGLLASAIKMPVRVDAVYQQLKNKKFDDFMIELRNRFGSIPVERKQALRIVREKGVTRAIAIVADQSPSKKQPTYWTKFLNQDTGFFASIDALPKLGKFPVFYMKIWFVKKGYYKVEYIPLASPPYDKKSHHIIERYIEETERAIREDPAGWLWSHKRWKRQKPANENASGNETP